jgi:predicted transcriptional regulator
VTLFHYCDQFHCKTHDIDTKITHLIMNALIDLFQNTPISLLLSHIQKDSSELVVFSPNESVLHVLKGLMQNALISAPIVNEEGSCIGMIDVIDILIHVIDVIEEAESRTTLYERLLNKYKLNSEHLKDIDYSHHVYTPYCIINSL